MRIKRHTDMIDNTYFLGQGKVLVDSKSNHKTKALINGTISKKLDR